MLGGEDGKCRHGIDGDRLGYRGGERLGERDLTFSFFIL